VNGSNLVGLPRLVKAVLSAEITGCKGKNFLNSERKN